MSALSSRSRGDHQRALEWGDAYEEPAPRIDPGGDKDPLGGQSRDCRAAGGLATLWRRFYERIEARQRFEALNELSKKSVRRNIE